MSKGELFVRTFVIGFGFTSGLFARIGMDPQTAIFYSLLDFVRDTDPSMALSLSVIFAVFSASIPLINLLEGYGVAGVVGLVAIGLGWFAGYFLSSFGIWLLMPAVILGHMAPYLK